MADNFVYSYSMVVVCAEMKDYRHQCIVPTFSGGKHPFFFLVGCQWASAYKINNRRRKKQNESIVADLPKKAATENHESIVADGAA